MASGEGVVGEDGTKRQGVGSGRRMRAEAGLGRGEYLNPGLASKGLSFRNCRRRAGGG